MKTNSFKIITLFFVLVMVGGCSSSHLLERSEAGVMEISKKNFTIHQKQAATSKANVTMRRITKGQDGGRRSRGVYFADMAAESQDNIYHVLEDQDLGYYGHTGSDSVSGNGWDTYIQAANDIYSRYNGYQLQSASGDGGNGWGGHRKKRIHHHHVTHVNSDVISYEDLIILLAVIAMGYYFIQVYWTLNSTPATRVTFARRRGMEMGMAGGGPQWNPFMTSDFDSPFLVDEEETRHGFHDDSEENTKIKKTKSSNTRTKVKRKKTTRTQFHPDTNPRPWPFPHSHGDNPEGRRISMRLKE